MIDLPRIAETLGFPTHAKLPRVSGVSIDTRTLKPGDLFVALPGQRVDGHAFIPEAISKGAAAILAIHHTPAITVPEWLTADPIHQLGQIATVHRQSFQLPIIALTGSNGKTTVKSMIAAILPPPALATTGNLNNHLGVPLMLLQLQDSHHYAVFELGANHLGEIAYTAGLVRPTIALINNIGPAHIGEFGSIEAIANAKGEIYTALSPEGIAIVNDDDDFHHHWDATLPTTVLRFSQQHPTDVYAHDIHLDEQGNASFMLRTPEWEHPLTLAIPGRHHISNALAAAACCIAAKIPADQIRSGLSQFQGVSGRQTFLAGINGATIIDDSYNANLRSVLAAIEVLSARKGKRILVLGDIGELGEYSATHHETIGEVAKHHQIDALLTCGQATMATAKRFGKGAAHCQNKAELIQLLKPMLDSTTTVLVKGSRSATMEQVVSALLMTP